MVNITKPPRLNPGFPDNKRYTFTYGGVTTIFTKRNGQMTMCEADSPEVCRPVSESAERGLKGYLAHLWDTGQKYEFKDEPL